MDQLPELEKESVIKPINNRKVWTQREDRLLEKAILEHGTNWKEVCRVLDSRNPSQCAQRWKRIKPISQRCRHQWSQAEDEQLLQLVEVHKRNWGVIAQLMNQRTGKQIRERYINKLNPEIRIDPWTKEEDMLIVENYNKFGSKWTEISKCLKGRPENMIKNRFYSYLRKEYMNIENPYYIIPTDCKYERKLEEKESNDDDLDQQNAEQSQELQKNPIQITNKVMHKKKKIEEPMMLQPKVLHPGTMPLQVFYNASMFYQQLYMKQQYDYLSMMMSQTHNQQVQNQQAMQNPQVTQKQAELSSSIETQFAEKPYPVAYSFQPFQSMVDGRVLAIPIMMPTLPKEEENQ